METPKKGEQRGAGMQYEPRSTRKGRKGRTQEDMRGWSMARALAEYKRWEWRGKGYSDTKEERWRQMARERWEKEAEREEGANREDTGRGAQDMSVDENTASVREETGRDEEQNQRKRGREAQQEREDGEERSSRQRGDHEHRRREEQDGSLHGGHEPADEQRNRHEELRSEEQSGQEQSGSEPTQAAGEGTERTQQREERVREDSSTSGRKRKGKEKMNTHQMEQLDAQQSKATKPPSSDEEDEEDERQRRRPRGREDDHDQPNEHQETPRTVHEGDGSETPNDIEAHEMTRIRAVSGGGVTVNESVCVRKNPTRGARPQGKAETKKPTRRKATKGPIFKGTYLQRTGAA